MSDLEVSLDELNEAVDASIHASVKDHCFVWVSKVLKRRVQGWRCEMGRQLTRETDKSEERP